MRVFELRSEKFAGFVKYTFDASGAFAGIDYSNAGVSIEQSSWLLSHLPFNVQAMALFCNGFEVTEIEESIDFKAFWDRYNDKARSSRVKTEKVWKRMTKAEQVKAYHYIPKYLQSIPGGIMKKYATTYLNDQLWNN